MIWWVHIDGWLVGTVIAEDADGALDAAAIKFGPHHWGIVEVEARSRKRKRRPRSEDLDHARG